MSRNCRKCIICNKKEFKSGEPKTFFTSFPLKESRCKEWLRVIGNPELVYLPIEKLNRVRFICSEHFEKKNFNKKGNRLKKTAIPKLKLTAPPLTDEQLIEFPFHVQSYRKERIPAPIASTSQASLTTLDVHHEIGKHEGIPAPIASTSQASLTTLDVHHEIGKHVLSEQPPEIPVSIGSTSQTASAKKIHQKDGGSSRTNPNVVSSKPGESKTKSPNKRKLEENIDMSPRKKKLVEQLRKTRLSLSSLQKSATVIEKIESQALKEIVKAACKNQNRKPTGRRWTTKNKISCLAILKRSAKTYRYLRHIIPLPSVKTLQNVLKKIPMEPGLNKSVLEHLILAGKEKNDKEKVWYSCVIHKTVIFDKIFATLAQLLIRRQCHRLNQGLALQEETLADAVKMAQQQGRAK